ncbi:MAG TPA: YfhO family protein, partial [Gemmatimonadaceae bacterium]|nr:YfhO family protein [Gemmatimonadaceae bacterium]
VYAIVPGTKFFRAPSTIIYVVALAIAVFAALGLERVLAREYSRRYLIGWAVAAVVMLLLGVSGALTSMATAVALPQLADRVPDNAGAIVIGSLRSFFVAVVTLGVLFAVLANRLRVKQAAWALLAITAIDLWSIERLYWQFSPPASQLFASDPIIEYLEAVKEPGRVLALQISPQTDAQRDPYLSTESNGLMVHGIREVVGYHGNSIGRYNDLIEDRRLIEPQIWHLLNAQYLLTDADTVPLEGVRRLAGPVKNAAGSTEYLYRLPGENAFAWVAPVIVKAGDAPVLATVTDPRFDPTRAALIDSAAPVEGPQISAMPAPTGIEVHTVSYAPGHIVLQLAKPAPSGSALVVSENYYPGWKATADGKDAIVVRTDYSLMGVVLPTGATRVNLTFTSPAFERGKMVTLIALALSVAGIAAGLALDRRRRG